MASMVNRHYVFYFARGILSINKIHGESVPHVLVYSFCTSKHAGFTGRHLLEFK